MPSLMVQHRRLGLIDSTIARLDAVANGYDEKLFLDRHHDTGQWCVYVSLERPQRPYPVFALSDRLPTPDELLNKLRASDTHKHNIREAMNKANDAVQVEIDYKSQQEVGKAAEMVHAIAIKQGMASDNQSRRKIVKS